jgi:peptidase E
MKLLLTSAGLTNKKIVDILSSSVGKPNKEISIVFIPTAANVEEGDKDWLIDDYSNIKKQGYKFIDIVDISAVSKYVWLPRIKTLFLLVEGILII